MTSFHGHSISNRQARPSRCILVTTSLQNGLHPSLGAKFMSDMDSTRPGDEHEHNGKRKPVDSSEINEAIEACGFELLEIRKLGGQGVILKMRNTGLDRVVAVKIPLNFSSLNESFLEEARTLAKLSHPNIVNVHSCGVAHSETSDTNFPFIEMEYIEGKSLREILDNGHRFSETAAVKIVVAICVGLHEVHKKEVDHGDIKPANILFRSTSFPESEETEAVPVIVDFGISRSSSNRSNPTAAGTRNYVAPEQWIGKPAHQASDIFSIGKLLHELLTGSLSDGSPSDGSEGEFDLTPELRRIIVKCCQQEPTDRFSSAQELAVDLERFLNDRPVLTGKTPLRRRTKLHWKRNHTWYKRAIVGSLLVAAIAFGIHRSNQLKEMEHQKEIEGYAAEANEIEFQFRGKADSQEAQLVVLERLEQKVNGSAKRWKYNQSIAAKHSRLLNQCAKLHRIMGNRSKALERNESAAKILEDVSDDSETELLRALAITQQMRGLLLEDDGKSKLAADAFQEMLRLNELAMSRPDSKWSDWANASSAILNKAVVLEQLGQREEALAAYQRSRELLSEKKQENEHYDEDLAFILNNEAPIYVEFGRHLQAISLIRESAKIRRRLHRENPTNQGNKYEFAQALLNCGIVVTDSVYAVHDQKIADDPDPYFLEAISVYEDLVEDNPKVVAYKADLLKAKCCEATSRYRTYALEHGTEDGAKLNVDADITEIVELSQGFELDGELTIGLAIFYLSAGRVSRDSELIETAVGQFEMMANHYTDMAELQFHLGWAYREADMFHSAEAGETEFRISPRVTKQYAAAATLDPESYKFYTLYREAIEDQIIACEKSKTDTDLWKTKLADLERSAAMNVDSLKGKQ